MPKRMSKLIVAVALIALGWVLGQYIENIAFFTYSHEISLIDVISLIVTVFMAWYVSRILEKSIQDKRTEKDLILSKIDEVDQAINSLILLNSSESTVSYVKVVHILTKSRKWSVRFWNIIDQKYKGLSNKEKDNYTSIEEGKADILGLFCITKLAEWGVIQNKDLMDNYVTFIAGIFRSCRFGAASAHGKANMMQFAHFIESGAITRDTDKGYYTIDFEKMKKDIEIIAGEYITLEGDGDYDKASQLIATKGIVSPILQKDLDRIAQAGIPKDIYFQQGLQTLGL